MDKQQIEILGRQRLIEDLLRGGVEVAMPIRDRGTDLIAYIDIDDVKGTAQTRPFVAVPIQMKAASTRSFGLDSKYQRVSNLMLVYVWGVGSPARSEFFALTYSDALGIATDLGWTKNASWTKGRYVSNNPNAELMKRLDPFRVQSPDWQARIRAVAAMKNH
jgi:hypothetical protein